MVQILFNANEVKPTYNSVIPVGWYLAGLVRIEEKLGEKDGKRTVSLACTWSILDGEQKGRQTSDWIMLQHPNETAVNIGKARLSAICHAINVMNVKDTGQLLNLPAMIHVGLRKRKDTGEDDNFIKAILSRKQYSEKNATRPGAVPVPPVTASGAPHVPDSTGPAPWETDFGAKQPETPTASSQ